MMSNMWLTTLNAAAKACSTITMPKEKSMCMLKFKVNGKKQMISKLQSTKSACKGNKSCIDKINKKIKTQQNQLKAFDEQYRDLEKTIKH